MVVSANLEPSHKVENRPSPIVATSKTGSVPINPKAHLLQAVVPNRTPQVPVPISKAAIPQLPIAKAAIPQLPIAKAPIPQLPMAKAPIPQLPMAKAPVPQLPMAKAPVPQLPIAKAPMPQLPITKAPTPLTPKAHILQAMGNVSLQLINILVLSASNS